MVIMTAKVPKRRLLLIVLLLIAAAVVLALCLHGAGSETEKPTKSSAQGATNEARISFLEGYGWQVEPDVVGVDCTAHEVEGVLGRNITLFAILIYELVGPLLTKMALQAAGEIHPMEDAVKNRRQINLEKANAEKK